MYSRPFEALTSARSLSPSRKSRCRPKSEVNCPWEGDKNNNNNRQIKNMDGKLSEKEEENEEEPERKIGGLFSFFSLFP